MVLDILSFVFKQVMAMLGQPFQRRPADLNLNIKPKTNHFDRRPTYGPYI